MLFHVHGQKADARLLQEMPVVKHVKRTDENRKGETLLEQPQLTTLKSDGSNITLYDLEKFAKYFGRVASTRSRSQGSVSDLGELSALPKLFGLARMPEGQAGYDLLDTDAKLGKRGLRYQVKSRSPEKSRFVNPVGTVGGFSSFEFDRALLVLMDSDLQVYQVWCVNRDEVRANVRPGRRDVTVARFIQIGKSIYQRAVG